MPQYQCHKKVWAFLVARIDEGEDGSAFIVPHESGYGAVHVDAEYMRKHKPQEGGYYVVYEDGYRSFSPAQAFEAGYTRI